jgi:hypothetical protein
MPRFAGHGYIRTFVDLFTINKGSVVAETFTNPLAAHADTIVVEVAMGNKTYTIAAASTADGYAHPVSLMRTAVSTGDTPGIVTFTGTDNAGATITEALTVSASDTTTVTGTKCFKTVTSVVGSGWTIGGATADNIICGFGANLGLGYAVGADADVLNVYDAASLATTASFAGKGDGTVSGSYFTPTGANGTLDYTAVYFPAQNTAHTAVTAATIVTSAALGFTAEVEEFGFRVLDAFVGTGGTVTYTLRNKADAVIATLTLTLATALAATTVKTTSITESNAIIGDTGTLTVKRTATGTAFSAGSGTFYVKLRQRAQVRP